MRAIGSKCWAIAEGFIPGSSVGPEPAMTSHETACILNTSTRSAHVEVMIYFTDRSPLGPFHVDVPPERTVHVRFNDLGEGAIPHDTDYACVLRSDVAVVVQHTRLDSRQAENALLSTVAYSAR